MQKLIKIEGDFVGKMCSKIQINISKHKWVLCLVTELKIWKKFFIYKKKLIFPIAKNFIFF